MTLELARCPPSTEDPIFPHSNIQTYASRVLLNEKQQHTQGRKAKSLNVNTLLNAQVKYARFPLSFVGIDKRPNYCYAQQLESIQTLHYIYQIPRYHLMCC